MENSFYSKARFIDGQEIPIRNIYCVGRNYRAHAEELGNSVPTAPVFFQKPLSSISQTHEIQLPATGEIHHELELVVCIAEDSLSHKNGEDIAIAGYALGLDLTDRLMQAELKSRRLPWFWSKAFRNATVLGEFQTPDRFPLNSTFWLKKNTLVVQTGSIEDMVFPISTLLRSLSDRFPLLRGDIIFTGTPAGVGLLQPGDHLELGIGDGGSRINYSVDIVG